MSKFQKATRKKAKARIAIIGPSGSGKTFTALKLAKALCQDGQIGVIDTERGSASKYAGHVADFSVLELETFGPKTYVQALNDAASEKFPVVVIDSLSHAWIGKDGALEQVDRAASKNHGNTFVSWRGVTPQHNALVDAILHYPGHVIVTMRAKTEYVMEDGPGGKKVPRKIGLAPVQKDGLEYEFDVVADINLDHRLIVSKSRCPALSDQVIDSPDEAMGRALLAWLEDGDAAPERQSAPSPQEAIAVPGKGVFDGAAADEGALRRMEADTLVNDWIAILESAESADHFEKFCYFQGAQIRALHANAKARLWRSMLETAKKLGIKQGDIAAMVNQAPELPTEDETDEGEAAQ